jgi:hypothetical protein
MKAFILLILLVIYPNSIKGEPKLSVDDNVVWIDGSAGIVVERAKFIEDDYYYVVKLNKSGMCWLLPESFLTLQVEL